MMINFANCNTMIIFSFLCEMLFFCGFVDTNSSFLYNSIVYVTI